MYNEIFSKYKQGDKSSLIPLLQDVQDKHNYLPEDALREISEFLDIALSRVYGVATFYNQFKLSAPGENIIKVCRGTACHVKNSANILFNIETTLKVKAGETTRDKKFTIEVVNCIGACSIAPVITINQDYHGRIAVKDVPKILKSYAGKKDIKSKGEVLPPLAGEVLTK
jgi:NADH-quinone oxidoreductase subunit E